MNEQKTPEHKDRAEKLLASFEKVRDEYIEHYTNAQAPLDKEYLKGYLAVLSDVCADVKNLINDSNTPKEKFRSALRDLRSYHYYERYCALKQGGERSEFRDGKFDAAVMVDKALCDLVNSIAQEETAKLHEHQKQEAASQRR
jgi:hypothetical protein